MENKLFKFLINIGISVILYFSMGNFDLVSGKTADFNDIKYNFSNITCKECTETDNNAYLKFCETVKIIKVNAKAYTLTRDQCGNDYTRTASGKVTTSNIHKKGCDRIIAISRDIETNLQLEFGSKIYLYGISDKYRGCYTFEDRMGIKTKNGKYQHKSIDILTDTINDARQFGSRHLYLVYYNNYLFEKLKDTYKNIIIETLNAL